MATYSLPPGWESDYDGVAEKWFFVHRPSGATQFLFPKAGDELKPVEMALPQPKPQFTTDVLSEKIDAMTISLDQQQHGQPPGPGPPTTPQHQTQTEPHYQSQNSGDWNQTAPPAVSTLVQPPEQPLIQRDYPKSISPQATVSPYPAPAPLNYQKPQQYVQPQASPQTGPVLYQQPLQVQGVPSQNPQQVSGQPAPFNDPSQIRPQGVAQQYVNPQFAQRPQANQVIRRKPGPNQQHVVSGQEVKPTSPSPQPSVYQVQQQNWQPQSPQVFSSEPPTSQPQHGTQPVAPQQAQQGTVPVDRSQSGQFQPQQQTTQNQVQAPQPLQYQNGQQQHIQPAQQRQGSVAGQQQPGQAVSYQGQPPQVPGIQQQRVIPPQPQYQAQNGMQPQPQLVQASSQSPAQQHNSNNQLQYGQTYHQPQQYQQTTQAHTPQLMQQSQQGSHVQGSPNSRITSQMAGTVQLPTQAPMPTHTGSPLQPMQPQTQIPQDNRRYSTIPSPTPQSIHTQSPSSTPYSNQGNYFPPQPPLSNPQQGQAGQNPNQTIYQQSPAQGNFPQQQVQYTQSQLQSLQPVTPLNGNQGSHLYRAQSGPASSTFAQLVERDSVIQAPSNIQHQGVQYVQQPAAHPPYQGLPQPQVQQPTAMQVQPVNNYRPAVQGQITATTGPPPIQMQAYQQTSAQPQIGSSMDRPNLMTRWSTSALTSSKKGLDKSKGWMKKNPLGTLAIAGGLGIVAEAAGVNVLKDAKMAGKIYNGVQHAKAKNAQKQAGQPQQQQRMSEAAMQAAIQKGIQDGIAQAMLQQGGHPVMHQGQLHQGYQQPGHPGVQHGQVHQVQQHSGFQGTQQRQIPMQQQHPTHTQPHHQQQQQFNPLQEFPQFLTHQHPHHAHHPQHQQQQQATSPELMIIPDPTGLYTPTPDPSQQFGDSNGSPDQSSNMFGDNGTDFNLQAQGEDNSIGLIDNDNDNSSDFAGADGGGGDGGFDFTDDSGGFDISDALSDQDAAIF